jgi:hypothetical protein
MLLRWRHACALLALSATTALGSPAAAPNDQAKKAEADKKDEKGLPLKPARKLEFTTDSSRDQRQRRPA